MSDVRSSTLSAPWQAHAAQIAQLFASVPAVPGVPVLLMLACAQARAACTAAAARSGRDVVLVDVAGDAAAVQAALASTQAGLVVCVPEVFGWVSKLAFLQGSVAIYTCGSEGEGTLLDRASHFPVPA